MRPAKNFSVSHDTAFPGSLLGGPWEEEAMGGWHGQKLSQMLTVKEEPCLLHPLL